MRRSREDYLSSLDGAAKRKKFITIDIESKDEDTQKPGFTRPFLIGIYDGVEYHEFRNEPHLAHRPWKRRHIMPGGCVDKALNFLLQERYKGHVIYAHNGGSFDHLFWLAWLRQHEDEFEFEIVPVQSSIQKITVTKKVDVDLNKRKKAKIQWTFLDSMKLFPTGLDKMLQTFKLGGKVKHDLAMDENDARWTTYLRQDCVGLYEALVRIHELIEDKLGGEVGMTAPSTAMKLFRRRFLGRGDVPDHIPRHAHFSKCRMRFKTKVKPGECTGCCHAYVRRAYYGGRTEPFTLGEVHAECNGQGCEACFGTGLQAMQGLHYYDLNSSYVAAMRETMPAGERYVEEHPDGINWRRHEGWIGFAECSVEIPETCHIPPLPHRAPSGKLVFPAGRFRGVWDIEELKLLDHPLVQGRILEIERIVWFKRKHLFREMVDVLWGLRDTRRPDFDEGLGALAKLMGNSTYGKFGMKQERTQILFRRFGGKDDECFLCGEPSLAPGGLCKGCEGSKPATGDPEDEVWYQQRITDAPYIIPQIAAHITTLARIALWNYLAMVVEKGGRIAYSDTDSIITDVVLPSSKELGALKDEYPGIELSGVFVQPKVYMIEESDASWSRRDPFEYMNDPNLDASTLDGEKPRLGSKVTMKGFPKEVRNKANLEKLRRGETIGFSRLEKVRTLARGKFLQSPAMAKVEKSFQSKYDKRVVHADGSTGPLVIDELSESYYEEAAE